MRGFWLSRRAVGVYLPSSGPPTASQAGSDPAAGCSEERERSGPNRYKHRVSTHAAHK